MNIRDLFFGVLLTVLFVLTALILRPFFSYILAAILLAFVLYPLQRRGAPRIGPRPTALVLVLLAVLVTTVPLVLLSASLLTDAAEASEEVAERPILAQIERVLGELGLNVEIPSDVSTVSNQLVGVFVGEFSEILSATVNVFLGLSLLVFLLYYLLIDGTDLIAWMRDLTPLPSEVQEELYAEANVITWAVLKGHVFVGIAQGLLGGIGLFVAGVPDAAFWTVVMILFSFVPILGVAAVWVPAGVYLLFIGDIGPGLFLLAYGATVISWVDNYLRALVVDRGADLHPGVVMVGVLGGIYLMGALGLFIGPIILAVFKATLTVFDEYYDTERGMEALRAVDSEKEPISNDERDDRQHEEGDDEPLRDVHR